MFAPFLSFWALPILLIHLGLYSLLVLALHRYIGSKSGVSFRSFAGSEALWQALLTGALAALLLAFPERYFLRLQGFWFSYVWELAGIGASGHFSWFGQDITWQWLADKLWLSFAGVAVWEEGGKYLLLRQLFRRHCSDYNKLCNSTNSATCQMDQRHQLLCLTGAGLAFGLGFAAAENLWYALNYGISTIYWRLLSSTVVHIFLGGLMALRLGWADAEAKPTQKSFRQPSDSRAFWLPLIWHGSYNTTLLLAGPAAIVVLLLLLLYSGWELWGKLGMKNSI